MSSLRKRLRELASDQVDELVAGLVKDASDRAPLTITGPELLRIAAGGKTQVLRNNVIKRLCDGKELELLGKLDDEDE